MPFTPYHFGPAGFIALLFRRWLDIPVFILANVAIDVEVLVVASLDLSHPTHRYCHTLLGAALVGLLWGSFAYLLRPLFRLGMRLAHIEYQPKLWTMLLSGLLGAALHVVIDAFYHYDVRPFWPFSKTQLWRTSWDHLGPRLFKSRIELICLAFLLAALILYALAVFSSIKNRRTPDNNK
jgi:membrane-bound metal-dependent hydrolase YbcI (DUF457 family)